MSNDALSLGWSFEGRKRCAKFGCGAVAEPDGWVKNAVVRKSSPFGSVGTATKCETVTTNSDPFEIDLRGVITRSSPAGRNAAGAPLTLMAPTRLPAQSRSKR